MDFRDRKRLQNVSSMEGRGKHNMKQNALSYLQNEYGAWAEKLQKINIIFRFRP